MTRLTTLITDLEHEANARGGSPKRIKESLYWRAAQALRRLAKAAAKTTPESHPNG